MISVFLFVPSRGDIPEPNSTNQLLKLFAPPQDHGLQVHRSASRSTYPMDVEEATEGPRHAHMDLAGPSAASYRAADRPAEAAPTAVYAPQAV